MVGWVLHKHSSQLLCGVMQSAVLSKIELNTRNCSIQVNTQKFHTAQKNIKQILILNCNRIESHSEDKKKILFIWDINIK